MSLRRYKVAGEAVHGISSLTGQWTLVTARSDTAGASTSVVGGALGGEVADTSAELAESMVIYDNCWDLKVILTAEEKTRRCCLFCDPQNRCFYLQEEVSKEVVEVVALEK